MGSMHRYVARSQMPAPRQALWDWFTREGAFQRLAPPFQKIEDIQREGGLKVGARTAMTVHVGPMKLRWTAKHTTYVEGELFQDEQVEGPFKRFTNLHRMLEAPGGRSIMEDTVEYELPAGMLGQLAGGSMAYQRLEAVFAYRHAILRADLARHGEYADQPRRHIAVTGASGLIGSSLIPFLTTGGHTVTRVPHKQLAEPDLRDADAVIHLAGAPIAEGRWTDEKKAEIRDSRVKATRAFCEALARLPNKPKVLISGSAIGYYGDRGGEALTEASVPGDGFLAQVCRGWEEATRPAEEAGIRVVHLRTGVVLSPAGGALAAMLPAFRAGAGGRMGSGEQYLSWISIEDEIGLIHWALMNDAVKGPLNAAAPTPLPQREFARTLGKVLHRPAVAPAPATALKLALGGEKARSLLLEGQKVVPDVALRGGFRFLHPELEPALRFLLGHERLLHTPGA